MVTTRPARVRSAPRPFVAEPSSNDFNQRNRAATKAILNARADWVDDKQVPKERRKTVKPKTSRPTAPSAAQKSPATEGRRGDEENISNTSNSAVAQQNRKRKPFRVDTSSNKRTRQDPLARIRRGPEISSPTSSSHTQAASPTPGLPEAGGPRSLATTNEIQNDDTCDAGLLQQLCDKLGTVPLGPILPGNLVLDIAHASELRAYETFDTVGPISSSKETSVDTGMNTHNGRRCIGDGTEATGVDSCVGISQDQNSQDFAIQRISQDFAFGLSPEELGGPRPTLPPLSTPHEKKLALIALLMMRKMKEKMQGASAGWR